MTNYEWLIKENKVTDFLHDFYIAKSSTRLSQDGLFNKWKIRNKDVENLKEFLDVISEWLQAEHKEKEKYVKLDDVFDLICTEDCFSFQMRDKLLKLSTKEIDE